MPSVLFCGGGLDSAKAISGSPVEQTTSGAFDSTYADRVVALNGSGIVIEYGQIDASNAPVDLTSGQTGYYHFEISNNSAHNSNTNLAYVVDSSGFPWVAIRTTGSNGVLGLFYNSGTGASPTWTQIGSATFTASSNVLLTHDLKVTPGSPHSVEWSVNGSLIQSGTFTQASFTSARALRFTSASSVNYPRISQVMITEGRSTIGAKVDYNRATGAGGNSGWTGAASNVNEAINNDVTVDTTTTAGVRQTYAMGDVTVPSGYAIITVMHFLRAKNDGASPSNIQSVVRQGGSNYDYSTNMPGIGTSFGPLPARYDTDPSTGSAWTQSGFNSAEFGYLSAA